MASCFELFDFLMSDKMLNHRKMPRKLVDKVISSNHKITRSGHTELHIKVKAFVTGSGHTESRLTPVLYINPPLDDIQELHFTTNYPEKKPDGEQIIEASVKMIVPSWLAGYRIISASEEKHEVVF